MSLSVANHHASLPVAYRLYLPEVWAQDSERRRKTGVPEDIVFQTKPDIALEQINAACKAGLPCGVVLMDAGYGCNTNLRTGVSALGFHHHATLCIAAYGFLISERKTIPPSASRPATLFEKFAVPDGYSPRGAAIAA